MSETAPWETVGDSTLGNEIIHVKLSPPKHHHATARHEWQMCVAIRLVNSLNCLYPIGSAGTLETGRAQEICETEEICELEEVGGDAGEGLRQEIRVVASVSNQSHKREFHRHPINITRGFD